MAKTKAVLDRTKTWKVGDTVSWSSQAAGSWRTKTGTVLDVAEPGQWFKVAGSRHILGTAQRRYLVEVTIKHSRGERVQRYFPTTTALQRGPVKTQ